MKKVRIKDIAAEAGVSETTVSRYLNGNYKEMSERTRVRIQEVVERNHYRPNNFARGLKSRRSNIIGVIIADISNPFSSEILAELSEQYYFSEYSLMIATTGNDGEREKEAIQKFVDNRVDGLVINSSGSNEDLIREVARSIPTILLDRDIPDSEMDLVTSNNIELTEALVAKLVRQGYRKLCLFTEEVQTSSVRRIRLSSFEKTCAAMHIEAEVVTAVKGDETKLLRELQRLEAESRRLPVAIVSVNGLMFLRLTTAILKGRIDVGRDFGLATFDENAWNPWMFGGVTTVRQDCNAFARTMHDRLEERIRAVREVPSQKIRIPGQIIERASTER